MNTDTGAPSGPGVDELPKRVLVVTAHPDDVDFGSAGTVASWTARGVVVSYCVCTSGESGALDEPDTATVQPLGAARLREAEQRRAAEAIGVHDVEFLGHPDGRVTPSVELRRDIARMIRRVRPDLVITHSPEIDWERIAVSHPDHRAVGEATLDAVYPDARNEHAHPDLLREQGLRGWVVPRLWLAEAPSARHNHAVDVTEYFPAKLAALRAHQSQTGDWADLDTTIHGHLEASARRHGLPEGRLAETFQVVDTA